MVVRWYEGKHKYSSCFELEMELRKNLSKLLKLKTYENKEVCREECVLDKLVQETHLARLDLCSAARISLSNKLTY